MEHYNRMYFHLFNAVTDALRALEDGNSLHAACILKQAQADCEEMFLRGGEPAAEELTEPQNPAI